MSDKIEFLFKKTVSAFKATEKDVKTHTHNPYLCFAAGCFIGGIIGPFGIPTAIGVTVGTVIYHEFQNQSSG